MNYARQSIGPRNHEANDVIIEEEQESQRKLIASQNNS
jgi:hypothetical protein